LQLSKFLAVSLIVCLLGTAAAEAATRTATKKASNASPKQARAVASKRNVSKGKSRTRSSRKVARHRRSTAPKQLTPTPERYMEVQQALAEKGYYKGPIDGRWDAECVSALKRFQEDQNIAVDGKLGALSIIALGLGPKREPLQSQFFSKPSEENPSP
jgi:peptidoglycan hydrolase-like protein with peptidoglycan-binding domain